MVVQVAEGTFCGLESSEIAVLYRVLAGCSGVGVEIGCCDGFSTAMILDASELHLHSVDTFLPDPMAPNLQGSQERFRKNIAPWADRHTLHVGLCQEVVLTWNEAIDFLYIDGDHNHESARRDYRQWTPWLKAGGLLAMHDARMGRPGSPHFWPGPSQVARDEIFGKPQDWGIEGEAFSLVIARRKGLRPAT